ncbi:MAG TPA: GNAT family N-acetyltransferase [Bacteroidaceae bacterium]|nr:GNAT family N-acetyltransferase [Bacteroidaceae bacterium]
MEQIIQAVPRNLLKAELIESRRLRTTNKSDNEIYVFTAKQAPNLMRETGRLREIAFRDSGGGTGHSLDIDYFDTMSTPYRQLIVWNPESEEIVGGYRFIVGTDAKFDSNGQPILATSHMFNFSERFIKEYLPYTIELGRSFVTLEYQSSRRGAKSLFALDNLWDGLGALIVLVPEFRFFFGKMTMYSSLPVKCRDMIRYFISMNFNDSLKLVLPKKPLNIENDIELLNSLFSGKSFKKDYRILKSTIRAAGYSIPPLINSYIGLSPTMKSFGTAINEKFGNVEETGILINVNEILPEKRLRHVDSFIMNNPLVFKLNMLFKIKRIKRKKKRES